MKPQDAGSRGAAVVEMAFLTVLLFILVAGIVDLGRAIYTSIGLQDAAEEGAMYASFQGLDDPSSLKQTIIESTSYPHLQAADIVIGDCNDGLVSVTVSHSIDLLTPMVGNMLGGSLTLSQEFHAEVFAGCP